MIIKAKAPVRISFGSAGDTDYYINLTGTGFGLNATIDKYSYCEIHPKDDSKIVLRSLETGNVIKFNSMGEINFETRELNLMKAVVKHFGNTGIEVITHTNAPLESGLGGSAAHAVAMIKAFNKLNNINADAEETAKLAYDLERNILEIPGGYQDQWASSYRGINFFEFTKNGIKLFPINLDENDLEFLERRFLLLYIPRDEKGSDIHKSQKKDSAESLAMLSMKKENIKKIRSVLQERKFDELGDLINMDWKIKKQMTSIISNEKINKIYETAINSGALGGRLIGSGAGGCFLFYCNDKDSVIKSLSGVGGREIRFRFERKMEDD